MSKPTKPVEKAKKNPRYKVEDTRTAAEKDLAAEYERKARREVSLELELQEMRMRFIPKNPTRKFEMEARVQWGAHERAKVKNIYDDGLFYRVRTYTGIPKPDDSHYSDSIVAWIDLQPYRKPEENQSIPSESERDEWTMQVMQQPIESLLHRQYSRGIEADTEYQRGRVWTLEDKESLIHSIMHNVEIGKFSLIKIWTEKGHSPTAKDFEVLDGKQRLHALTEFYEGRFAYKGRTFDQMSWKDQNHFTNYTINVAEVNAMTFEKKCRYFVRLNTAGKPQDPKHLEKVLKLAESVSNG